MTLALSWQYNILPYMTMILDAVSLGSQRRRTPEGFLFAPAVIGRTGVLVYQPGDPSIASAPPELIARGTPIRILRSESDVFDSASMSTFAARPVLNEHTTDKVTPANYRDHLVGITGSAVIRDGDTLRTDLMIYDSKSIEDIENGKVQLSQGYEAKTDWTPGSDPRFGEYDGKFTNIVGNHVALTLRGRSGADVRVLDAENKGSKTMKRTINGVEIDVPDNVVQVIDSYIAGNARTVADLATATATIAAAAGKIAVLEKQVADDKAEIARVTDSAYIDGQVKERAALVETAKAIAPAVVCDSLSNDAIRAAVVTARGIVVTGKDAINGAFAALAAVPASNGAAVQVSDSLKAGTSGQKSADQVYNEARAKYLAGNTEDK